MNSAIDWAVEYGNARRCLKGPRDGERVRRLSLLIRHWTVFSAERFVQTRRDDSLLCQYGSDCTPLVSREQFHVGSGVLDVRRSGKASHEYLIQRLFITGSGGRTVSVLDIPYIMPQKTAFAHFNASRKFMQNARELGHRGRLVDFQKYDRAIMTAMRRLVTKFWSAYHDKEREDLGERAAYISWITHWVEVHGCFCHDLNGGLKWSVLCFSNDKEVMRKTFLVMESLRHGYNLLVKWGAVWMVHFIDYTDAPLDHAREIYVFFKLEGAWLEEFCDLEIRFSNGRLLIADRHRGVEGVIEKVFVLFMKVWRYQTWSMSRFLGSGAASRQILFSEVLGVSHLVKYITIDQKESSYYIGGYARHLTVQVRHLIGILAVSSRVGDAAMKIIMKDDRLPIVLPNVDKALHDELEFVFAMPHHLWSFVAEYIGMDWTEYRRRCFISSLVSAAYPLMHARPARKGVFKLLLGDRQANLEALSIGRPPDDEGLFKVYEMVRMLGYAATLDELECLSRASWSTLQEEKGHVFAKRLMKDHSAYGAGTLQDRSQICQFQQWISVDREETKLVNLRKRLAALNEDNSKYHTGRQQFLKELNEEAARQRSIGRNVPPGVSKQIMSKHGERWRTMDADARAIYEERAAEARQETRAGIRHKRADLLRQISDAVDDKDKLLGVDRPVLMRDARLSDADKIEFNAFFEQPRFAAPEAKRVISRNGRECAAPPDVVRRALESIPVTEVQVPKAPPWMSVMCWNRIFFVDCVVRVTELVGGDVSYWKFVFGLQSPSILGCMVLLKEHHVPPVPPEVVGHLHARLVNWDHYFLLDWGTFAFSDEGRWSDISECSILTGAQHLEDKVVVADGAWVPFDEFKRWFPPVPPAKTEAEEGVGGSDGFEYNPELRIPWFSDWWTQDEGGGSASASRHAASPSAHAEYAQVVDAEAVMDVLEHKRTELDLGAAVADLDDFVLSLRGGGSLAARTGKAFDYIRAAGHSDRCPDFFVAVALQKTFDMDAHRHDNHVCKAVCRAWCVRMQYCIDRWILNGRQWFADSMDDFAEDPEVQRLYDAAIDVQLRRRIQHLRSLTPRVH